ncbi:MAG: YkgJ family cysteine cluster protein, partial [Promethearchaeota archaeon]
CDFSNHDIWVYPYDMVQWLKELDNKKYIPLFLSALIPVKDMDDIEGVGLPSQKELMEVYDDVLKENTANKDIVNTLKKIKKHLKIINPNFNSESNYCIYYNPNPKKGSGHCCIYEERPIQCRSFPYDYPAFTKIEVPDIQESEDIHDLPMCPEDVYSEGSPEDLVKVSDNHLDEVLLEKSNYRMSAVLKDWASENDDWKKLMETDIIDLFLEMFHKEILQFDRDSQESEGKRFVGGKRPNKRDLDQRNRPKGSKTKSSKH